MATLDATTQAEYAALFNASDRAALIVSALSGAVTVNVHNDSDAVVGTGTMSTPWASVVGDDIVVGSVVGFVVTTSGTPNDGWYLRFVSGSRYVQFSFGLLGSGKEAVWSRSDWTAGTKAGIRNSTITVSGNVAPVFTVAPASASIPSTGGTIQFAAVDPNGDTVTYSLPTTRSGITINSSGLVTVASSAAGTSGNITVRASDGTLSADATCAVTVASSAVSPAHFIIPSNVSTWNAASAQPRVSGGTAVPNSIANPIIELSAGTSTTVATAGTRTTKLAIQNLKPTTGTATVRNPAAGRITIEGGSFTFELNGGPTNVVVDGTNGGQTYGIRVRWPSDNTMTSGTLLKLKGEWRNVTIKGVECDGRWSNFTGASYAGIGISPNDASMVPAINVFWDGLRVTQCWVHHVCGEGMYIGPNWTSLAAGADLPVKNVEIDHCLIEWCGRDGCNGKNWWEGNNSFHDNIVRNVGQNATDEDGQRHAFTITGGCGRVYNNTFENCGEKAGNFASYNGPPTGSILGGKYGPYSSFAVEVFNNVVVNAGMTSGQTGDGFNFAGSTGTVLTTPKVYNNTIVNCEGYGINLSSTVGGWARNNVLVGNGSGGVRIGSGSPTQANNTTSTTLTADYRLTSEIAASGTIGVDISATDLEGTSRAGTASRGAYEYA